MRPRKHSDLKRERAFRDPKIWFHIVTEGKNTEPDYLDALARKHPSAILKLEIFKAAGDPSAITKKAMAIARDKNRTRDTNAGNDQVWVVFDRDSHEHYETSRQQCKDNKIRVAFSDPCFELWLVLHYQDYDAPCHRKTIQKELECLCEDYSRRQAKTADFASMLGNLEQAEERAEKQAQNRISEENPEGNPSTNFYLLTREIKKAAKASRR